MFDGVPEQFHQFITPRTTSSLPLHLPIFPLHASTPNTTNNTTTTTTFPTFDPYNNHHHSLQLQQSANLLHHPILHHGHGHHKINNEEKQEEVNNSSSSTRVVVSSTMNFEIERDQREELPQLIDPWSNDEVLALLRIRSSMESWFPEFTWEHVSRKLAEVGYKRSAEKCKEKFEEETRYFNNINNFNKNNNYRFVSELEELYQGDHQNTEKTTHSVEEQQDKNTNMGHAMEEDSRNDNVASVGVQKSINKNKEIKKRKRGDKKRFEVFKGFCESVVKKMMEQQEEMHNRLIEDMVKRDEEKFTREEAWKKQEMEKMNMELELMAREQAIAGDRQANIIQFLNKFKVTNNSSSSTLHSQNPNPNPKNPSSSLAQDTLSQQVLPPSSSNNPSSSMNEPLERNSVMISKDDIGRRWPKDEVLALINLRCTSMNNSNNNNNGSEEKEGNKVQVVPLWERISKGMLELGYKRSAKRCKEKWENINKYFRKTKDANKKRSIDSRTCPYFHLLSTLYKQGKLVQQSEKSSESNFNNNNNNAAAEAEAADHQTQAESSQVGPAGNFTMLQQQQVHHGGEKKTVFQQVPPMDFDQF